MKDKETTEQEEQQKEELARYRGETIETEQDYWITSESQSI